MIQIQEKNIFGQKIRTNNQHPATIGELWTSFLQAKRAGDVYAVYHHYDSDYTGDYDLLIGTEERRASDCEVTIQAGKYHVVEVDHTDPKGVFHAWIEIWRSDLKRTYQTDFEHYRQDGRIRIYLSIEP